ncbi:hypothetical protein Btoyo_0257 [Bacillus toyonensis BCT-7112]|nr:hypothetical protein Btoyo_0257 [Bacillus toyonensis BCT-7112]PKR93183.1 hypothetical protein bcere0024_012830 [Bacillus cereus Rock4-18]
MTANKIGIPLIQSTPIKIEVSPIIEPTDTSIPPVTITKVIGIAAIAINRKSFVLKRRLLTLKKSLFRKLKRMNSIRRNTIRTPSHL